MAQPSSVVAVNDASSGPEVERIHHVEIYVSNLRQSTYFYRTVLGLSPEGTVSGWGGDDRATLALMRGDVRLLVTAPLAGSSEVAEHIRRHGEGIKDVAFAVSNLDRLCQRVAQHEGVKLSEPIASRLGQMPVRVARLDACGSLVHSLIECSERERSWTDAALTSRDAPRPIESALEAIDHIAVAVPPGELERWVDFYCSALGLAETYAEEVSTEYSGMRSKVVATANGLVRLPLLEPVTGRRQSQIDTFLHAHDGAGVQHLAFRSHDILASIAAMGAGLEFLPTPGPYYDALQARVGELPREIEALSRHGVLIDRDATGMLLQAFTKPIGTRPTLFLEVVERRGATGFGSGNIKALFEAVERQLATSEC